MNSTIIAIQLWIPSTTYELAVLNTINYDIYQYVIFIKNHTSIFMHRFDMTFDIF